MGKKRLRAKYTSKGERNNSRKDVTKLLRRDYMNSIERDLNQQKALASGKNVVFTVPNPNKTETNQRFIRVKGINARNARREKVDV